MKPLGEAISMLTFMVADLLVKTGKVDVSLTNSKHKTVADLVKARPSGRTRS
jgi:hypothetical protein